MQFPRLYKKSSLGKMLIWDISTEGAQIITKHGQEDGQIQTSIENVKEGKNLGKVNATTPETQAEARAQASYVKRQERGGYMIQRKDAEAGKRLRTAPVPMLAHKYTDKAQAKIKFPAYIQPKLDGIRCTAVILDGSCTLYTRSGEEITAVPHINEALAGVKSEDILVLDGELYNHDYHDKFEIITSMVRQKNKVHPNHKIIEFHAFDLIDEISFVNRYALLTTYVDGLSEYVKLVETHHVHREQWEDLYAKYMEQGYEGCMLRNSDSPYVFKRSYDLQKVKQFQDEEFEIIGVKEGKGKLEGHGIFTCRTKTDKEFDVKCKGETENLKDYFENPKKYIGQMLTVRFQNLTEYGAPRFPTGISLRDYE